MLAAGETAVASLTEELEAARVECEALRAELERLGREATRSDRAPGEPDVDPERSPEDHADAAETRDSPDADDDLNNGASEAAGHVVESALAEADVPEHARRPLRDMSLDGLRDYAMQRFQRALNGGEGADGGVESAHDDPWDIREERDA